MNEDKILNEAFKKLNEIFQSNNDKESNGEVKLDKTFIIESIRTMAKSYNNRSLIIFLGAGCSIEQKYPSWDQYIDNFLEFWTYHINNLTDKSIEQSDMQYITSLKSRTDIQKKRKIDLAYEVIHKYAPDTFNEIKHDFEKLQFITSSPIKIENEYYNILSELEAFYITTNYDQQFENILRSKGKLISVYEDIDKFITNKKGVVPPGLLYLHGTIGGNTNFLINSSESYINLYEKNKQHIEKLIELIDKEDTSILFIGSSMDEEEILSIFYGENLKCNVFSLLKSRDLVSNKIEDRYFISKKNIKILRFGSKYNDLKVYLKKLCDVLNKLNKHKIFFDTVEFKGKEKRIAEVDEELSTSDLSLELIEELSIYKNEDIYDTTIYPKTWNRILNETSNDRISINIKLDLISNIKNSNMHTKQILSKFFLENKEYLTRISLKELLNKMSALFVWGDYSEDNNFYNGCVFLYNLDKRRLRYQEINTNVTFKLNEAQKEYLVNVIRIKDEDSKFTDINSIITEELGDNIKFSITNNLLNFNDDDILKIFDYKYTQKIAIYLFNSKKLRNETISSYIEKSIDFNDEYFGKELNKYVKENNIEVDIEKYKDYISQSIGGWIVSIPYLRKTDIINEGLKSTFEYILNKKYPKVDFMKLEEYSDCTQSEEFNKLYDGKNNDLFFQIYKYIILREDLFDRFGYGILKVEVVDDKPLLDLLDIVLNKYVKNDIFDFSVKEFYEKNIDNNLFNIEDKINKYDMNKLINKDIDSDIDLDEIKLVSFINWDIGRYIGIIKELDKNKTIDLNKVIEDIDNIEIQEIKNYLKGAFFKDMKNQMDDKNAFIGYSHNYIINDVSYKEYEKSILNLLKEGTSDEFIYNNLFRSVIWHISPEYMDNISLDLIKKFIPHIPKAYEQIHMKSENVKILIDRIINEKELDDLLLKNLFNKFIIINKESQNFFIEIIKTMDSLDKTIEPYGISSNIYGIEKGNYYTVENYNKLIIILINNKWFEQNSKLKYQLELLFSKYKDLGYTDLISKLLEETKDFIRPFYDQLKEVKKDMCD